MRLSITRVGRQVAKQCTTALTLLLLSASCSAPSWRTDGVATASQAVAAADAALLSPELDLDRTPGVERARSCPQAAFGTASYLVTHSDRETGQIGATRIGRAGAMLQAFDIPGAIVSRSNVAGISRGNGCAPVVFAGGAFIALWLAADSLKCTRVTEDGTLLGVATVVTGLSGHNVESIVSDGSHVLASMDNGEVALVGTDCSSISAPVSLPATPGASHYPMGSAFDGTQYWIAYSERLAGTADRFLVQAVTLAGAVSGAPITVATAPWVGITSEPTFIPAVQGGVAAGGGKTVLAYSVFLNKPPSPTDFIYSNFYFAELSATGVVSNVTSLEPINNPLIGFAGDGFAVYSSLPSYNYLVKRLGDGSIVSGYSTYGTITSFARDGSNLLVVSAGLDNYNVLVSPAQLLGPDLGPIAPASVLQHMSERHSAAVIASGDQTSLAVWRGPGSNLWGSRLSSAGTVPDPARFSIVSDANSDPAVASDGTDFLVGWTGANSFALEQRARFVLGSTGELGAGVEVAAVTSSLSGGLAYGYAPVLASNGSDYLMVWGHGDQAYEAPDIISSFSVEAARISGAGEVLDDPPLVLQRFSNSDPETVYGYLGEVAVAYDGTQYVVVSHVGGLGYYTSAPPLVGTPDAPIIVQHVSAAGEVGMPVETPWRASVGPGGNPPTITWGGGLGLVTFRNGTGLFAGRLSPSLTPLDDPPTLVTDPLLYAQDWRSSTAWDGTNYWVSWKDGRRKTVEDLYVARVSPAGAVLDPVGIALSLSSLTTDLRGEVVSSGGMLASEKGRALAAYTRFDPAPDVYNFTLHGRWLSTGTKTGEGGEAGANDGSGGTLSGTGGRGSGGAGTGEAGSVEEAGSPNDNGGASGGSTTTNGGTPSASAGRSGGPSGPGGEGGATDAGGSSEHHSGDSGCSIADAGGSPNLSPFWLMLLALPFVRNARSAVHLKALHARERARRAERA